MFTAVFAVIGVVSVILFIKFLLNGGASSSEVSLRPSLSSTQQKENLLKAQMMQDISLRLMADNLECSPDEVEKVYKENIYKDIFFRTYLDDMRARADMLLAATDANQHREAREATQHLGVVIKPQDTASGMMHKWIQEVITKTNLL